ncbi:hypothetical protein FJTKL_12168 [Diaporthe vaccinii]|uniref:Uncharacterized protein n=1 Tax=Diaporthe vaccinii TaxID=105482 RepID=A0ABR4EEQ0_9PEZI
MISHRLFNLTSRLPAIILLDQVRRPLRDSINRRLRVGLRDKRHHARVHHTQALDPVHLESRVDHAALVPRRHAARPHGVVVAERRGAHVLPRARDRVDPRAAGPGLRAPPAGLLEQRGQRLRGRESLDGHQVPGVDGRRGGRVGRRDVAASARERVHEGRADAEVVALHGVGRHADLPGAVVQVHLDGEGEERACALCLGLQEPGEVLGRGALVGRCGRVVVVLQVLDGLLEALLRARVEFLDRVCEDGREGIAHQGAACQRSGLVLLVHLHEELEHPRLLPDEGVARHDAVGHLEADARHQVVLEVLAHAGVVHPAGDAELLEQGLVADARELQQLGGLEHPGRKDDLAPRLDLMLAVRVSKHDGTGCRALQHDLPGIGAGQHVQVGALSRRCVVCTGRVTARLGRRVHARRAAEGPRGVPAEGVGSDPAAELLEGLDPGPAQGVLERVGEARLDRAAGCRHLVVDPVDSHVLTQLGTWWH